jgi:hypothetical protein
MGFPLDVFAPRLPLASSRSPWPTPPTDLRTQLKNPLTKTSTKRNKKGGQFMAVKKSAKKFKGVRREK